jgi:hypothetical protein
MNVGDSVRVVFGVVAGQNENLLKVNSDYAQSLYNANFVAPIPPIPPVVQAIPGDRKVTLIWGDTSESSYEPFAEKDTALIKYDFEGYRIYRSRTGVEGDFEVLAEYDLKDGITNDNEDDVDPVYGTPIVVTVHLGEDTGLKRYYVDSVNVLNGETYYYSVVAYDYQPKKPKSFESGKRASMVQVVPGTNAAGYIAPIAPDTATHTSSSFLSDGYALVTVVDPALVTGDDYQITFNTDLTWNLIDVTTGDTLLANQENQSGDYDYPFVDGIQVRVAGPSIGFNEIDLVSDSLSFLFYEAYMGGRNALNNNDFRIFKIKFVARPGDTTAAGVYQDSLGNNPWGYFRQDPTPVSVPFEIWDLYITLTDTTDDVRIWPLMYDLYDGRFHTDDYIMFLDKNNEGNKYSEDFWSNPDHDPSNSAYWGFNTADPMSRYDWDYRFAFSQANPVWAKGDYAIMVTFKPNTPNDVFSFSTRAAYISASQAKTDMDKIKVVPNPYFVRNELDRDPNVAHLMLTHLPEVCTIRLYTLAGNLIQKIEHTSGTGQEIWNALTRNDQIPASGVYIYHISSEFGEKVGRFAVIR